MRRLLMAILLIGHLVPLLAKIIEYDEVFGNFGQDLQTRDETNFEAEKIFMKRSNPTSRRCIIHKNIECIEKIERNVSPFREPYYIESYHCEGCFMKTIMETVSMGGVNINKTNKVMYKHPFEQCYNLEDYVSSAGCNECKNSNYYYYTY